MELEGERESVLYTITDASLNVESYRYQGLVSYHTSKAIYVLYRVFVLIYVLSPSSN